MKKRNFLKKILSVALVVFLTSSSFATAETMVEFLQRSEGSALNDDGTFTVTASYSNNTSKAIEGGFFILAAYNGSGVLRCLEKQDLTAAVDETVETTFDLAVTQYPVGEYSYKIFYWDSDLTPLTELETALENLALRRAGYQSDAVDEFNTVTLVSDGIVSDPKVNSFSDGSWTAVTRYYREWIYVDLGEPTALSSVGVDWGASYAVRYQIQTSDDAVNWTSRVHKGSNAYSGGGGGTANALGTPTAPWAGERQTDDIADDVTARYVRILCESCSGGASGETYVIDGIQVNGHSVDKYYALDGFDSYWKSESDGQEWVYVDLGADSTLLGAKVVWGGNYATDYEIQISGDAETWTTAATASGAGDSAVSSSLHGSARYVRLLCNASSGSGYIVKEFEVYGCNDLDYELEPMPAPDADGTQQLRGGNWKVERASEVRADGFALSQTGFDDASWLPATVPSTTLASYINAGAVPDPYYDMNNETISDTFFTSDFWYRNSFEIPASQQGKDVWLNFDAINYRADVYFNGYLLPNALSHRTRSIEGGFIRGKFDVTDYVKFGGKNYLAVFIQMNDTPWCYTYTSPYVSAPGSIGGATTVGAYITRYTTQQGLAFGPWPNGGNLGIDNPTFHAAAGWDWMPTIRGRDTGIYRDVFLSYTGGAEMIDPWMVTDLTIDELPAEINVTPLDVTGAVVTQPEGQNSTSLDQIFDNDMSTYWLGDNSVENPAFTVALPEEITTNAMLIDWGEVEPAAAFETQHAEKFTLEVSTDGATWENYGAYPAGTLNWFGYLFPYPADPGPSSYDGAINNNLVPGPNGNLYGFLAFDVPKTFQYLRFTTLEKLTSVNSGQGIVAPKIRQINFYAETRTEIESATLRNYVLHDEQADLIFKTEVKNNTNAAVDATVSGVITPGNLLFTKTVSVPANQTVQVDVEDIIMRDPDLWWPNTYGDQPLYTADVQLKLGETVSDVKSFKFGVREFSYPIDGGRLGIYCNGAWIIAKGGNWGMDDALQMDTPERYDDKVRLHAEENMTMIRNWVGQTNNDAFYDACDKYGIMVWDDFWLANPYDGPDPKDRDLFSENAVDRVKRTRAHPSLTVYCGRNESNPPNDLINSLTNIVDTNDGTRFYFSNSAGSPVGSGGGYSLADYTAAGSSQGPKNYFNDVSSSVLRSERGIPNVPSIQSIQKFVKEENQWPISDVWGHHDWTYFMNGPANTYMNALKSYMPALTYTFPAASIPGVSGQNPDPLLSAVQDYKNTFTPMLQELADKYTLEDFHDAAQMINLENHKALFQALTVTRANGLLMWMSQSSWPSFMWQTYDYYLDTNGGYFGTKAGNQPTQPVWDPRNDNITLCNYTPQQYTDVTTALTIYDLNGNVVTVETYDTPSLAPGAYGVRLDTITAKMADSPTDMVFIKLVLKDGEGNVLGENIYWHNKTTYLANQALTTLADVDLTATASQRSVLANGNVAYTLTIQNETAVPAVQTRIRTISEVTGEDVLPAFYSDNYFTLMPGDTKVITVEFSPKYLEGGDKRFELSGWNTVVKTVA
ncbi:MAG: discoidin domain-containing protein [Oscillospiraceae bacterium]|nr:discoidin domain-containing protein [Oscillospiraceae bacterium]